MSVVVKCLVVFCFMPPVLGVTVSSGNIIRLPWADTRVCSPRASCRYAVCLRSDSLLINPRTCIFVHNSCHCSSYQVCMPSKNIRPRAGFLKFDYTCQNPLDFMRQLPYDFTKNRRNLLLNSSN